MYIFAGKLLESVRTYKDVRIVTMPEKLLKLVSLSTFSPCTNSVMTWRLYIYGKRMWFSTDRIAWGFVFSSLASSRCTAYFMNNSFKDGKCDLLYTDTDSFLIQVHGYEDINPILKANSNIFDFRNLPRDHCLYDRGVNKRKLGCLKLETGCDICCEFVALSPKCYSLLTYTGFKQMLKGSRKSLSHET